LLRFQWRRSNCKPTAPNFTFSITPSSPPMQVETMTRFFAGVHYVNVGPEEGRTPSPEKTKRTQKTNKPWAGINAGATQHSPQSTDGPPSYTRKQAHIVETAARTGDANRGRRGGGGGGPLRRLGYLRPLPYAAPGITGHQNPGNRNPSARTPIGHATRRPLLQAHPPPPAASCKARRLRVAASHQPRTHPHPPAPICTLRAPAPALLQCPRMAARQCIAAMFPARHTCADTHHPPDVIPKHFHPNQWK